MTFLLEITPKVFGMPEPATDVVESPAWMLQARCAEDRADSCGFLKEVAEIAKKDKKDRKDTLALMHKLFMVAKMGHALENFYDDKQCHCAHEFKVGDVSHKIWRIRKNSVRVYFYYTKGKLIYLAAAQTKRKNRLNSSEKKQLEDEVKLYITAQAKNKINIVVP